MSELAPHQVSALDQFSGMCTQLADMTVAHHQHLVDGHIPSDLACQLSSDLHDALIALFVTPTPPQEDD